MVKPESMSSFVSDVIEMFGYLLAQKIAMSPLTPKDTTRMAKSFSSTYTFSNSGQGYKLNFITPFYTEFVHEGTRKIKARPFVNQILFSDGNELMKKAFKIIDKRYINK